MKLINMEQKPEQSSADVASIKPDQSAYPYGLKLYLDAKILEKLGIKDLPKVGSVLTLEASVEIVGVSMNESSLYGDNKNCDLQITDMALSGGEGN